MKYAFGGFIGMPYRACCMFAAVITVFIVCCVHIATPAFADTVVGNIISVTPGAYALREGKRVNLEQKSRVYQKDVLVTDTTGKLKLILDDDTTIALAPATQFALQSVVAEGEPQFHAHLSKGLARLITGKIVEKNPGGFKVTAPEGVIGIRGTMLAVESSDKGVSVFVFNSSRVVTLNGIPVRAGQKFSAGSGAEGNAPLPLTPEDVNRIEQLTSSGMAASGFIPAGGATAGSAGSGRAESGRASGSGAAMASGATATGTGASAMGTSSETAPTGTPSRGAPASGANASGGTGVAATAVINGSGGSIPGAFGSVKGVSGTSASENAGASYREGATDSVLSEADANTAVSAIANLDITRLSALEMVSLEGILPNLTADVAGRFDTTGFFTFSANLTTGVISNARVAYVPGAGHVNGSGWISPTSFYASGFSSGGTATLSHENAAKSSISGSVSGSGDTLLVSGTANVYSGVGGASTLNSLTFSGQGTVVQQP